MINNVFIIRFVSRITLLYDEWPWPCITKVIAVFCGRLCTGVGRAKTVMRRWCYLVDAQSVDCDCGDPHTMAHLLSCRLLDVACTADDLATVTERAMTCAHKWEKLCEGHERRSIRLMIRRLAWIGIHEDWLWWLKAVHAGGPIPSLSPKLWFGSPFVYANLMV